MGRGPASQDLGVRPAPRRGQGRMERVLSAEQVAAEWERWGREEGTQPGSTCLSLCSMCRDGFSTKRHQASHFR